MNLMEMVIMSSTKKEKLRDIPIKNYVYLFLILLSSVLFLIYIYTWYKTYNENKLNTGIMNHYLTVINYNELEDYIIENKDAILYVSILGEKEIYSFEEKFKNSIMNNNLKNAILYLDLTNENIDEATKKLQINHEFPYLVIYTNGKISDTYNIKESKYNTKKVIKYLHRIGAGESD